MRGRRPPMTAVIYRKIGSGGVANVRASRTEAKKTRVDEPFEKPLARGLVETEQAACLGRRQMQAGHLEILGADAIDQLLFAHTG